jgi:hypothetical protein
MFAILPLLLLAVVVVLVAAMPWHRPDPNHLFFLELLQTHLPDETEMRGRPAEGSRSGDKFTAAVSSDPNPSKPASDRT